MKRIHIMNKREISEIKKQFKKDNNAITRICGCYVDAEKQIKTTLKEAFFALSEEEIFKYYEIFKKPSPAESERISTTWSTLFTTKVRTAPTSFS